MLLCDHEIRALSLRNSQPMIHPFSEAVSGGDVISYGVTGAGYDLRLGYEVLMFKNTSGEVVNPKRFKDLEYRNRMFDTIYGNQGTPITIPAHGYILGISLEYIRMPRNLKGRCVGKSTYARCGIIANLTPLEPEWEGFLTIEIGNITPCPALVFMGEGICQLEFELLNKTPEVSYADKNGIYQNQMEVTPARVKS